MYSQLLSRVNPRMSTQTHTPPWHKGELAWNRWTPKDFRYNKAEFKKFMWSMKPLACSTRWHNCCGHDVTWCHMTSKKSATLDPPSWISLFPWAVFLGGDYLVLMQYLNFVLSIEIHQILVVYVKIEPRVAFPVFVVEEEMHFSASLFLPSSWWIPNTVQEPSIAWLG